MAEALITWSDDFLIGVEELDYEHRKLVEDINRLHDELSTQKDRARVETILGEIHGRLSAHFALEEHWMKEHDFVGFPTHKQDHDELLDDYVAFMARYENEPGEGWSDVIEGYLDKWIVGHILKTDRKMIEAVDA